MTDKYHSDTQEVIDRLYYNPECKDTGDRESGTNTITATSKQAVADYSKVMTMAKPSDARMLIKRIGTRLSVTRDSGSSGNLYCSVYVDDDDGSEADHCLYDGVDIQVAALNCQDVGAGLKEVIFNLLKDGAAHTFYWFFWVDSGDSVISLVQLWYGVGSTGTAHKECFTIIHIGFMNFGMHRGGAGTGTMRCDAHASLSNPSYHNMVLAQSASTIISMAYIGLFLTPDGVTIDFWSGLSTDLKAIRQISAHLRSEK